MNRFEFLKSDYEDLYKLCSEAETNRNMNKARQVLEIIVRQFGATKKHLFDRIGELSDKKILPQNLIEHFHIVRIVGNKDSHGNEITEAEIDNGLNSLFEIVVWLAVAHDKKIYTASDFNDDDIEIVQKYQTDADKLKSKRDAIKNLGIDVNPLDIEEDELNFDNESTDELVQDVFETADEYAQRIQNLPLHHIGYGILDKREQDAYTGLIFPMFHIEHKDKVQFSDINAFVAKMESSDEDFIDGKIVVGLKVFNGKVYCNYDKIYLQSQNGNVIQMIAICWSKYDYESSDEFNRRLSNLPILPLGEGKPIRKEYDLNKNCLPFKIALYKYVQSILHLDKMFVEANRDTAKIFCSYTEHFVLYGKVNEILKSEDAQTILRHIHCNNDIKCYNKLNTKSEEDVKNSDKPIKNFNSESEFWYND